MKCQIVQEKIDLYLDGSLSEREQHELINHMNTCIRCKKFYEGRKAIRSHIDEFPRMRAPEDFVLRVKEKIETQKHVFFRYKTEKKAQWLGVAAAFFVVLALSSMLVLMYHQNGQKTALRVHQIVEPTVITVPIPASSDTPEKENTIRFLSKDYATGNDVVVQMPASVSLNNYNNMENYYLENVSY